MRRTGMGVVLDELLHELTVDVGEAVIAMRAKDLPSMRPYYLDWVKQAENIALCGPEFMPKSRTIIVPMSRPFMNKNGGPVARKFGTKNFGVILCPSDELHIAASNACGFGEILRGQLAFDDVQRARTMAATEKRILFLVKNLDGNPRSIDMTDESGGAATTFKHTRLQLLLYLMRCFEVLRLGLAIPAYVETLKLEFDRARWLRGTQMLPEAIDLELHCPSIW